MAVIPITLTVSLSLVLTFAVLFVSERRNRRVGSAERDSLQPLSAEVSRTEEDSR